jgi:tRNASer (uridine44-2'-O)-methyltransferase
LVLRSETLSESDSQFPDIVPNLIGLRPIRVIHRKLLPRRPGRDTSLEQFCTLYGSCTDEGTTPSTLVLTPVTDSGVSLPYYHPAVSHLAFRYISSEPLILQIDVLPPLPGTPTDMNSRLYRTCLALLDTLHRYGWGVMTNYKKRVMHDCLVPCEAYQELYLVMRERHRHLVDRWHEVTYPPIRHSIRNGNLYISFYRTSE